MQSIKTELTLDLIASPLVTACDEQARSQVAQVGSRRGQAAFDRGQSAGRVRGVRVPRARRDANQWVGRLKQRDGRGRRA